MPAKGEKRVETVTVCQNGHEVGDGESLCTICWSRVGAVPQAAEPSHFSLWPPSPTVAAAVGGVLLLVGATGAVAAASGSVAPPALVAEPAAQQPAADAGDVEAAAPVAVAVPALATVAAPVSIDLCVPVLTSTVRVSARENADAPWLAADALLTLGDKGSCASDQVSASIAVPQPPVADGKWRVISLDQSGVQLDRAVGLSATPAG